MVTSVSAEGRLRAETVPLWRVWAGKAHLEETRVDASQAGLTLELCGLTAKAGPGVGST